MIRIKDFNKITDYIWEIPKSFRDDMKVPARIYASEEMLENIIKDRSIDQLINVSSLPGIQKYAIVMPDVHEGYGFPIGGIAATKYPDGVISPGGIGYDINCGVRLLTTVKSFKEISNHVTRLAKEIQTSVPSGVGKGGNHKFNDKELDRILKDGVKHIIKEGYGDYSDIYNIESQGDIAGADSDKVSAEAKNRGRDQLGTMGAGNHFIEVDKITKIYDDEAAEKFHLFKDQIVILIHTGSRGLGHQVATDYIRSFLHSMPKYNITMKDRELACVPLNTEEGTSYFAAMCAAANFAFANRQLITHQLRNVWNTVFGQNGGSLNILYDVAHNIAKIEKHKVNGKEMKLIVHRKGATRAFGPQSDEIPEQFKNIGQPVIIPGSMGTASYILKGTSEGMMESFGSACHGAGRQMSRSQARKKVLAEKLINTLNKKGITIHAGSLKGISEEAPEAYKDVERVIDVVHNSGIAKMVAKLRPVAVIKG